MRNSNRIAFARRLLFAALLANTVAGRGGHSSKRGLALISQTDDSDVGFLTSDKSPIGWYYTWSPYGSEAVTDDSVAFVPMLHGVEAAEEKDMKSILGRLPSSSTHLLTFNEPDHDKDSGGSDISPKEAAKAYIEHIVPLRDDDSRPWNISHPVVTGSGKGIEWLKKFNESCYDIDSKNGCPTDFIAVHWYGDFPGLANWLGTLRDFYGIPRNASRADRIPLWITEMAFSGEDAEANTQMLNDSMRYLDADDGVEGYAWFGAFRTSDANDWTGKGVSMLDSDGGLTKLGAEYLGGEDDGFEEGQNAGLSTRAPAAAATLIAVLAVLSSFL